MVISMGRKKTSSGNKLKLKIDYNSPVVLSFAFISFAALILDYITRGTTNTLFFSVYRSSLLNPLSYVRAFGHVLGHANFEHYIGNMLTFLLVGPMLEEKYGSKAMLECMCVTAVVTAIINCLLFPHSALLGASGIVFMMIIMSSVVSLKNGYIPLTLIVVVILYLGNQVLQGIFSQDNISQLTHIVGGVLGGVFGIVLQKD